MAKPPKSAISPTREEDYPEWYQQVIKAADLAEVSPVRGCMVIKPWGWAIWENMQRVLDGMFKATGHENAYFPLFIPLGFLEKEAQHVEGFAKECAVVTHHRLESDGEGGLRPAPSAKLEEPLIIRPTSETIIGSLYAKWVQSYRDLPILINQWANVVRWELRTRMFLRTTEFLWQEGHTAHATREEAIDETLKILDIYADFAESYMAMPVIKGEKTAEERFPGAVSTYAIEAMMQDRKALQAGTSHFLGQNFARAQEIKFQDETGTEQLAWTTSWGVSTRLVGGLIMTHADDDGLVLPPRLAPKHVVIMPIYRDADERRTVMEFVGKLEHGLGLAKYDGSTVRYFVDDRDLRGGEKAWQHIKKGVPIRVEVGPRDVAAGTVFVGRRDKGPKEKSPVPLEAFTARVGEMLEEIQSNLFLRARALRDANTREITSLDAFRAFFTPEREESPEIHGGFAVCPFVECEETLAAIRDLKVTIRCVPVDQQPSEGRCVFTGQKTDKTAVFAKAY